MSERVYSERVYVAIDLETTGLDPRRDTIIEIGAVKFQGRQVIERLSLLVNPCRSIPLRIQQFTGIRDADVAKAPTLGQVLPEVRAFVGMDVAAIIAHNTNFELSFFQANGVNFQRPAIDTVDLASILLPGQASYNLGELCNALGIPLVDAHRAPEDAEATAQLFMAMVERLNQQPLVVLHKINEFCMESDWSIAPLIADAAAYFRPSSASNPAMLLESALAVDLWEAPPGMINDKETQYQAIPVQELTHYFAPGGPLAQQLGANFELRSGQVTMAEQVMRALNEGDHLMVEAGTGIGKSMAYLLPAALWSLANARRVVIATHTITLQDQLLDKDIPQIQALLGQEGNQQAEHPPLRAALLKGRGNYLCLRRFLAWCSGRRLSNAEMTLLAKVLVWLPTTASGDVGELGLVSNAERTLWERICSDSATCSPERCAGISNEGIPRFDFYLRAQRYAESVHLLVVNHALLLADIAANGYVLPKHSHLVVDEAHHLEEAATDQFTYEVEWPQIQLMLKRLNREGDLLSQILAIAQRATLTQVQQPAGDLSNRAIGTAQALTRFAQSLLQFAKYNDSLKVDSGYAQRLAINSGVRSQPMWSEVEVEWDSASDLLHSTGRSCSALARVLEEARWHEREPQATLLSDLQSVAQKLNELAQHLDTVILSPENSTRSLISWLEINDVGNSVSLAVAPTYVGDILEREIVHTKRSAIFTSATLRANANFAFIRERLGLWDVNTAIVESPFDYERSTLLYMPSDLMTPNHMNYQPALERAIIDATLASEGRSLVLFTSYAHLRQTADAIRSPLDKAGITVLQHGSSGRQRLLREYRATERAVLLGTRSFWEGVDLPGDELRTLMIVRLPFAVPNDPLVAARSAEFEDPFTEYTLPDAILRFRQGFGRLIRRASDRGVVVLLDSRVWKKEYGQAFLDALPQCTVRRSPLANLGEEVRKWLV